MQRLMMLILAGALTMGAQSGEPIDAAANAKIRAEGLMRSQAPALFHTIVDTIGPRLAGSPEFKRSAEWARDRLTAFGLSNARLEAFEFGRGWVLDKLTIEMIEPRYMPLHRVRGSLESVDARRSHRARGDRGRQDRGGPRDDCRSKARR